MPFIISLDFELHWGGFEKWDMEEHRPYFLNTRERVIPEILELFKKYDIHATWATVGILFHKNMQELKEAIPTEQPSYISQNLSAYKYIENNGIGKDEKEDPMHYGASLIHKIKNSPNQEVGTHTYSHYFCNEPGQNPAQFRADLQAAKKAAEPYGIALESLVFPRNQFNESYLAVCREERIRTVRTNPTDWFWNIKSTQKESRWLRFSRGLDAYLPTGDKKSYILAKMEVKEGVLLQPASRLLRSWSPKLKVLNKLKLRRIFKEMTRAARTGEAYHLWWHPHNFGWYPEQNLKELESILKHFSKLQIQYGMQSKTMNEVADDYNLVDASTNK